MTDHAEKPGAAFQWNAGGWFGGQIGATCWIAVFAVLLSFDAPMLALWVGALFAGANLAGTVLWVRRARMSAYLGVQVLMAICGAASLATVALIDGAGLWDKVDGRDMSAGAAYWTILAVYAGLFLLFWSLQRANRTPDPS